MRPEVARRDRLFSATTLAVLCSPSEEDAHLRRCDGGAGCRDEPAAERLSWMRQFLLREYLFTQFTSQVLPPSTEKACSDRAVSGVIPHIEKRTRVALPLIGS